MSATTFVLTAIWAVYLSCVFELCIWAVYLSCGPLAVIPKSHPEVDRLGQSDRVSKVETGTVCGIWPGVYQDEEKKKSSRQTTILVFGADQ